jgi:antitoxin YefM
MDTYRGIVVVLLSSVYHDSPIGAGVAHPQLSPEFSKPGRESPGSATVISMAQLTDHGAGANSDQYSDNVRNYVRIRGSVDMSITATAARKDLYRLIEEVNANSEEVEITSKNGSAFLVGAHEFNALKESAYLLRSPVNAARLASAAAQVRSGDVMAHDLVDDDE